VECGLAVRLLKATTSDYSAARHKALDSDQPYRIRWPFRTSESELPLRICSESMVPFVTSATSLVREQTDPRRTITVTRTAAGPLD
jgi:hypothetical protein